ncbi:MAG: biotin carboxylase, partial [Rhizobiales bacterium]|nr:biotin carboxylase [Hyphomicrobiales bacterium]
MPNVLSEIKDWDHLQEVAKPVGNDLVLQSAFGDSGHTTFFIKSKKDFLRYESEIVGQGEIK